MINTVCFDLDGTLVNSKDVILSTFDHVFKKYFKNGVESSLDGYRKYMGPLLEETFSLFTKDNNLVKNAIEEYVAYYSTIEIKMLKPFKNINSTLEWLKASNINICLLTNKRLSSTVTSMNFFDINKYFDYYITSDEQKDKPKPNAYPIELCANNFNVQKENIIMVGDNEVDILCGKNAGAKTALVSYNPWFNEVLKTIKPDYILNDMSELKEIIKGENK